MTQNLSTEQKQTHRHGQQTCDCRGGGGGGGNGMDWEFRVNRHKLLHWEWRDNEVLLCPIIYAGTWWKIIWERKCV